MFRIYFNSPIDPQKQSIMINTFRVIYRYEVSNCIIENELRGLTCLFQIYISDRTAKRARSRAQHEYLHAQRWHENKAIMVKPCFV